MDVIFNKEAVRTGSREFKSEDSDHGDASPYDLGKMMTNEI
jgi:hypothetical protein